MSLGLKPTARLLVYAALSWVERRVHSPLPWSWLRKKSESELALTTMVPFLPPTGVKTLKGEPKGVWPVVSVRG